MSTRSFIGKYKSDEEVEYIYCHFDGYIACVGRKLLENYKSDEVVDKLLALGDLSYLGKTPVDFEDGWDNLHPSLEESVRCLSYRSRGDENVDASTCTLDYYEKSDTVDFKYLWKDGEWFVWNQTYWTTFK